ncbi:MAG: TIGR04551 family protein [Polyangiaceae bacterium]
MASCSRLLGFISAVVLVAFASNAEAQSDPAAGSTTAPSATSSSSAPLMPTPAPAPTVRVTSPGNSGPTGSSGSTNITAPSGEPSTPAATPSNSTTSTAAPLPDPFHDRQDLARQGAGRPASDGLIGSKPSDVYSEDWWTHVRPVFEVHGYFRTRGQIYHNFFLGRHNAPGDVQNLWPQPIDQTYTDSNGTAHNVLLCGSGGNQPCYDKTEASANMRFRMNPELHISDNLRIVTQVDFLNNLVLGSTPDAYALQPNVASSTTSKGTVSTGQPTSNGYRPYANGYNGYAPLGAFTTTQGAPTAGINSLQNSVDVQRAWAEYMTPVGQLRFGRMPSHWGLGMLANSGDGIDQDYQTNSDRIMFVTGIKSIDLYFGGAWDFVSTGPTNASPYDVYGGQSYNTCNLCNVNEYMLFVARKMNPELQRLALSHGDAVINGGLYTVYRNQILDVNAGQNPYTGVADNGTTPNNGLDLRGAWAIIPDAWLQVLWRKFRIEGEFASIWGSIQKLPGGFQDTNNPVKIRQYGLAAESEYRAIEDKLRIKFGFGWASGDPWVEGLNPGSSGLQTEGNTRGPISTFHFNPGYNVDMIFFRQIMTRVEGAYYFRPSVDYDFIRDQAGQKFGGGAAIIWSRASEFTQTPGNARDLGVELDLQVYYQAKDGSLNDDLEKIGGFYAALQYGVFFPLGGLDYLPGVTANTSVVPDWSTSAAQSVKLFLGVMY